MELEINGSDEVSHGTMCVQQLQDGVTRTLSKNMAMQTIPEAEKAVERLC